MSEQGFHHTPNFREEDFEVSNMYHQQMYNMNHQQGMSGHHAQQPQYDHQSSYSQMPHDSGGYVIQQLGNPLEVGHQHMQSNPQAFEMVNHNSVWSQRASPPQATLAGSPSGESDDSDDSGGQNQVGQKRPSPDMEDPIRGAGAAKRAKPMAGTKKKKKRDPNEPTKPVSAYALFFRDTQAAIKGQNPNASFGEVSKIVASMWDALDAEHKNVYKKKTEAAKKEYLKQLAAYRASLVSKGNEQEPPPQQQQAYQNRPGPGYGQYQPYNQYGLPSHSPPGMGHNQHQQMMAHQAAMNRHMASGQQVGNPGPMIGGPQHTSMMQQQHMAGPPMGNGQPMVSSPGQQGHMGHSSPAQIPNRSPVMNNIQMQEQQQQSQQQHNQGMVGRQQSHQQQQQQFMQQQQLQHQQGIQAHQQMPMQQAPATSPSGGQIAQQQGGQTMQQQQHLSEGNHSRCIRAGCANPAVHSPEWEDEYCSNECVVSHCRDVFNAWVASNHQQGGSSFPPPVK